jgi:Flp pilus assembly protein TadG
MRSTGPRCRKGRSEAGAAAVEFALVLTVLVAIIGGIVDFGLAFNAQMSLTHAAREGVREEAINSASKDPIGVATNAFSAPAVTGFTATVTSSCPGADNAVVRTSATYNYFFLPFGSVDLTSEGVMRCGG